MAEGEGTDRTFPELLRAALEDSGVSIRALARGLAGAEAPKPKVESERRQVAKYLRGDHVPGPERARALEKALRTPKGYFTVARDSAPRLPDQLARMLSSVEAIQTELRSATADRQSLARRLAELAATVDEAARETAEALEALQRGIDGVARRLPGEERAGQGGAAR